MIALYVKSTLHYKNYKCKVETNLNRRLIQITVSCTPITDSDFAE